MCLYSERLSLQRWSPGWVRQQHLARYEWAHRFTNSARVLDAACGTGYGVDILLRNDGASWVDGFDISPDALEEASAAAGKNERVFLAVADVACLPVQGGIYDVYVSFETIEHVQDPRGLVQEARRVLRPSGTLIVSTPNRDVVAPGASLGSRPLNPSHVCEYNRLDLECVLSEYFPCIDWYGQTFYPQAYVAVLTRLGRHAPRMAARLHQARKLCESFGRRAEFHDVEPWKHDVVPEFLIAVCRDRRTPGVASSETVHRASAGKE